MFTNSNSDWEWKCDRHGIFINQWEGNRVCRLIIIIYIRWKSEWFRCENVWRSDSWYLLPFRPWHCQCSYEVKQLSETNPNRRLGSSTLTEHYGHIAAHLWLSTPFQRNRPQHKNKPQINQNLHFELCPIEFVSEFIQMRSRWTEENGNLYLHMQCI